MRVEYSSAANRDVKRAIDYYHREAGPEVAARFIARLEVKVLTILKHPTSYRVITRDLRCVDLDRFPYQIVSDRGRYTDQDHICQTSQTASGLWA